MPWVTDVYISDVDGGVLGDYELTKDLIYEDDKGRLWVTPSGFIGDLSSFPWFVRTFLPKTSLAKAPWPHDYGYREQPTKAEYVALLMRTVGNNQALVGAWDSTRDGVIDRKVWDKVYLQGAIDEGMSPLVAKTLYQGLRVGGWLSWRLNGKKKSKKSSRGMKKDES